MTSAVVSGTTGSSKRRRSDVPPSNGGFATTLNDARGSGRRRASSTRTSTCGNRRIRPSARPGSISTATTRAPARTSAAASLLLRRKCWPRPRDRGRTATEDHQAHNYLLRLADHVVGLGHGLDRILCLLDGGLGDRNGHGVVLT